MAGKRITKSAIDWVAFAERVPVNQKTQLHAFKVRSEGYLRKMMSYPENPPSIDWSFYRSRLPSAAIVEEFEKQYKSLKIPYPADKLSVEVDAQQKEAEKEIAKYISDSNERIEDFQNELEWYQKMIPTDQMTMDDVYDYFPDQALDQVNRPSFWPHDEESKPNFPWKNPVEH